MSELTIDRLGLLPFDETSKPSHSKRQLVTSIIEWTQCFTNYIAILIQAQPSRTTDLLGYQHLILEAHLEYSGDGWAVYDRRFRQITAAQLVTLWAKRDGDLWNMVFASSLRRPYCRHCFGSTHPSEQCSGAPDSLERVAPKPRFYKPRICRDWNYTQCLFPRCRFIHACLTCYYDPSRDSNHKVIHCPTNSCRQQEPLAQPLMGTPYQYPH